MRRQLPLIAAFSLCFPILTTGFAVADDVGTAPKDLAKAASVLLPKARTLSDFRYEQSGDMGESFDRAAESLKKLHAISALREDFVGYVEKAAAANGIDVDSHDGRVVELIALLRNTDEDAARDFGEVNAILANADPASDPGAESAASVLEQVMLLSQAAPHMRPTMRVELAAEMQPLLEIADDFAPGDEGVAAQIEAMRPMVAEAVASIVESSREEIAANTWPGGDTDSDVAKAGMAHLKAHGEWGGDTDTPTEILKVATHGEWFVARENILGQPLAYAHPAWIAVREVSSPEGIVNVLNISLVTKEAEKNTDFGPVSVSPGMKQMLQENLPQD